MPNTFRSLVRSLVVSAAALWLGGAGALGVRLRVFAETEGLKLGQVAQPLRAALTGSISSPPIFDVLVALGRDESLARLRDQAA